jgi:hypothetical protein
MLSEFAELTDNDHFRCSVRQEEKFTRGGCFFREADCDEFFRDPFRLVVKQFMNARFYSWLAVNTYPQDRMYNYFGYTTNDCQRNSLPVIDGLRHFSGLILLFKRTYQTPEDSADCITSRCCDIADTFANENISVKHTLLILPKRTYAW